MKKTILLAFIIILNSIVMMAYTTADFISAMKKADYDMAIRIMDDIIKNTEYKDKTGDLYYKRACAYEKKGNYVYAAVDCSTALRYSPNNKDYLFLRGRCKMQVNDPTYIEDLENSGSEGIALLNENKNTGQNTTAKTTTSKKRTISDVDINIPSVKNKNENTFVLIFSNENYMEEGISNVEYAINDGKIFREYCLKTLGIPDQNIHIRENATKNQIRSELKWAKSLSDVYGKDGQLIFYYTGHGMSDEKTKRAFLLPADGIANDSESGYSLSQLYKELGVLNFNASIVLLDACFSGTKRNGEMLTAAKGIAIKPTHEELTGNVAVLSATEGDDTAYPDDENEHGLFTYFLLKKLQDSKGTSTLSELADYVSMSVRRASVVKNMKIQEPSVNYSSESTISLDKIKLTR